MTARKCLTEQEMTAKGMSHNAAGFWITAKMPTKPAFTSWGIAGGEIGA
jgi:hypothetical protein